MTFISNIKKSQAICLAFLFLRVSRELSGHHFVGLQTLLALHNLEGDLLAFLQALEAIALDRAEMHENVRAIVTADEAETLGVVEPLDGTDLTIRHIESLRRIERLSLRNMRWPAYWCARKP